MVEVSEGLIIALIGMLAVPLGVLITWMVNRKKHVADIYGVISASSRDAVESMQIAMEALHSELDSAHDKIDILIAENAKMQVEINELRKQNLLLLEENHILHAKIDRIVNPPAENA